MPPPSCIFPTAVSQALLYSADVANSADVFPGGAHTSRQEDEEQEEQIESDSEEQRPSQRKRGTDGNGGKQAENKEEQNEPESEGQQLRKRRMTVEEGKEAASPSAAGPVAPASSAASSPARSSPPSSSSSPPSPTPHLTSLSTRLADLLSKHFSAQGCTLITLGRWQGKRSRRRMSPMHSLAALLIVPSHASNSWT